jgi:hypothetical protein
LDLRLVDGAHRLHGAGLVRLLAQVQKAGDGDGHDDDDDRHDDEQFHQGEAGFRRVVKLSAIVLVHDEKNILRFQCISVMGQEQQVLRSAQNDKSLSTRCHPERSEGTAVAL